MWLSIYDMFNGDVVSMGGGKVVVELEKVDDRVEKAMIL